MLLSAGDPILRCEATLLGKFTLSCWYTMPSVAGAQLLGYHVRMSIEWGE